MLCCQANPRHECKQRGRLVRLIALNSNECIGYNLFLIHMFRIACSCWEGRLLCLGLGRSFGHHPTANLANIFPPKTVSESLRSAKHGHLRIFLRSSWNGDRDTLCVLQSLLIPDRCKKQRRFVPIFFLFSPFFAFGICP